MRFERLIRFYSLMAGIVFVSVTTMRSDQGWLRAATDDVVILSDASPKVVTEYAVKYTAFRQAFNKVLAPAGHRPPPVTVVLFQNEEEFAAYLSKNAETGSTIAARIDVDNTAMVAFAVSSRRDEAFALAYEFDTVWSLRRVGYALPRWMVQGTGRIMASLRLKKGECVIDGKPNRVEAAWRAEKALPWERFFEVDQDSAEYVDWTRSGQYQAQAWAIMRQVLLHGVEAHERFEKLAKLVKDRQSPRRSIEEILGASIGNLELFSGNEARPKQIISMPCDEAQIRAQLKVGPVDGAELLVRLSDLLIAYGREEEGTQFLEKAVSLSPDAVCVNESLARRELRRQDQSEAARFYRAALAAGSMNPNALLVSATERLDQTKSLGADIAGGGGRSTLVALEEIHRALQLDRSDLNSWRLLGRAYFVAEKASDEGAAELGEVINEEASSLHIRYYRGLLYSRLGKVAEAIADLEYVILHPRATQALRMSATTFKVQVQFIEDKLSVEKLIPEGRYREAYVVLKRGTEQSAETSSAKNYEQLRAWVDENETWSKVVALYREKDWSGSLMAVKSFMETYPESTLLEEARQLEAGAEDFIKRATRAKGK